MEKIVIKTQETPLRIQINRHIESFMKYRDKVKDKIIEIERLEKKMTALVYGLEPVESLIYNQNPQLKKIFESLKRVYGEGVYGTDRKVSK